MEDYKDEVTVLNTLQANLQQAHQIVWGLHWSMSGKGFLATHPFLDDPLDEIHEMVDWVAERTVQVGGVPVDSYEDVLKLASHASIESRMYEIGNAVSGLITAFTQLGEDLRAARKGLSPEDTATASQIDGYIGDIDKYTWMLQKEGEVF